MHTLIETCTFANLCNEGVAAVDSDITNSIHHLSIYLLVQRYLKLGRSMLKFYDAKTRTFKRGISTVAGSKCAALQLNHCLNMADAAVSAASPSVVSQQVPLHQFMSKNSTSKERIGRPVYVRHCCTVAAIQVLTSEA